MHSVLDTDFGNRRKKIKEEPLSDIESIGERQVKIEADVKQEQDTEVRQKKRPKIGVFEFKIVILNIFHMYFDWEFTFEYNSILMRRA